MPRRNLLLLGFLLFTACSGPTNPDPSPKPPVGKVFRVVIMGLNTDQPSARIEAGGGGLQAASLQDLYQVSFGTATVRSTTDIVPVGQPRSSGSRYVYLTTKLNITGNAITNLTAVAAGLDTNPGQTAIETIEPYPGLPGYTEAEKTALALSIQPASPVTQDPLTLTPALLRGEEDALQFFDESEVANLQISNGYSGTTLPYGFVAHSGTSRTIQPGNDVGTLSMGFRIPLQALAKNDPYKVVASFVLTSDSEASITESLEAQLPGNRAALDNRISWVFPYTGSSPKVKVLPGTTRRSVPGYYVPTPTIPVCGVRLGGPVDAPTAMMLSATPLFVPVGRQNVDPNLPLSLAVCAKTSLDSATLTNASVVNHWSSTPPSTGTVMVNGNRVTVPVWSYTNLGGTPLPGPNLAYGQVVDITLTNTITSAGANVSTLPYVFRARTATQPSAENFSVSSYGFNYSGTPGVSSGLVATSLYGTTSGLTNVVSSRDIGKIFAGNTEYSVGLQPADIGTGDLNGDGKMDIFTANAGSNTVSILLGNGDGTLQAQTTDAVAAQPESVERADLNGDGKLDLITANKGAGTLSVLLGMGDGTFAAATSLTVGTQPSDVVADDLNNDGKMDLLAANTGSNTVSILLGKGDGTFAAATSVSVGTGPTRVRSGDFNNDGLMDLVALNTQGNSVSVALNSGAGNFGAASTVNVGTQPKGLDVGDMNGDGNLDIVTANTGSNTVSILNGQGNGSFSALAPIAVDPQPNSIVAVDSGYDGKLDLMLTHAASEVITTLQAQ